MFVSPHGRELGKGTQSPASVGIHLGCQVIVRGQIPPQVLEAINLLYWPPANGDDGWQPRLTLAHRHHLGLCSVNPQGKPLCNGIHAL